MKEIEAIYEEGVFKPLKKPCLVIMREEFWSSGRR